MKIDTITVRIANHFIEFVAGATIDADGSDNRHNDPYFQPDTSLRHRGKPVDAESVPYVVLPPAVIRAVVPVVLGCFAHVRNTVTGASCVAVVADVGPSHRIGELSCEAARRVGLDGNPNHGGTSRPIIHYQVFPGVAANIDGVQFALQRFGRV